MKSVEYFYSEKEADNFIKSLHSEAEPEKIISFDEDIQEKVYIVYYIPPKA